MINFYDIKTEDDIVILANLAGVIWREYWGVILSQQQIEYMLNNFHSLKTIREQIANENYIYKILKIGDENIGYFGISPKNEPLEHLFLSKLYIKDGCRGKGYGKIAFEEIKKIAEDLNLEAIRLTVNKYNNSTIEAYKKWGFEIIDSCIFDIGEGFIMDDFIMENKLL